MVNEDQQYEYRVDGIEAAVTDMDISKGVAGKKVASQVEIKLQELAKEGYEFYREFPVSVDIRKGCNGASSSNDKQTTIIVMVFRRPRR